MTVPVLNLIPQKHSLTTSRTAVSHGKIGRQLRALVRVLQRNVFSTLRQVGEAPAKPSYFLSLWVRYGRSTSMWKKKGTEVYHRCSRYDRRDGSGWGPAFHFCPGPRIEARSSRSPRGCGYFRMRDGRRALFS